MNTQGENKKGTPGWAYVVIALLGLVAWQLYDGRNSGTSVAQPTVVVVTPTRVTTSTPWPVFRVTECFKYPGYTASKCFDLARNLELENVDVIYPEIPEREISEEEMCTDPAFREATGDSCDKFSPQEDTTEVSGCPNGCKKQIVGCDIKGNISQVEGKKGERIYHMPGDKDYKKTKIRPQYGERWFCTPEEAENNGWRHALR